ncbi:Tudor domain containing protein 1/6 like [Oopsacas minuta]|uniref:Tudor domain containing protein 1/6 like n=2 Tax=Oopsacas minuta TaxID=111878 RepID=A0AAV7KH50_9METZ|nr:Tudor domain containing protein 1/6 like [Oopsacas minuta]
MDRITSYYVGLESGDLSMKSPTVGDLCCCKYLDMNWYRAIVREVKGTTIHVYFVDYGNLYDVSKSDCKLLHESFFKFPKHSIECCLHDVILAATHTDWSTAAISFFKRQAEKKQLYAKFIQKNSDNTWEVNLTSGNRDIGKLICEAGMAISKSFAARYAPQTAPGSVSPLLLSPTHNEVQQSQKFPSPSQGTTQYGNRSPKKIKEIILPRGHSTEVYVSYAISPNDFSIQLTQMSEKLDAMMEELARHCERSYNEQVPRAQPQMVVAAKFTEDDKWYRAIILNTDSPGVVKVHYIDYGNKENLDMGRIKPLPSQLYSLQAQAIKCSLRGFSKDTRFSTELMDQFRQTVTDRFFTLQVLNFQTIYYEVDLVDNASTQSMAALFHVKSSGNTQVFLGELKPLILSSGTEVTAQLCVMHSPNDFYMQVSETSEALNSMEFELNRTIVASKAPKSFELKVGVPCAACFSTIGTWYRAKVLAVSSPKIHVLYVDYGNDEWLLNEKIQPLPQKFLSLPCQAFRCALRPHQNRYTDEDVDKFKSKLTAARDIRVKIVGHNDQYIYLVELYTHQTNEALKFTSSQPICYPSFSLPVGVIDRFKVCHILPSGVFYLQRENAEPLLKNISSELSSYASRIQIGMKAEAVLPGLPCAVKFYQDNQWYRGKVLRAPQQQQVEVQFVDYGNDDMMSIQTLAPIPDSHLNQPAQAIPAMLQSNQEQGNKPSIRELENFQAKTHEQILKVKIISKTQETHIVKMYFSNDEEILMSGLKPPGFRKGRPEEESFSPNELPNEDRYGGGTRHGSAPNRDSRWNDGEFKQRGNSEFGERNEGRFGGRDRREGGFGERDRNEGGFGGRDRGEGGFGNRDRSEGGFGNRDRSEGGFGRRDRNEGGGFGGRDRGQGEFGNRDRSEGGFGRRDRNEGGGFGGRDRNERGGFGGRDRNEGGFGRRDRNEGGFGGRSDREEGGYRSRDGSREGRYGGRSDRDHGEGGFGRRSDRSEGGFGGRSDRFEGGFGRKYDRNEGRFDRDRGFKDRNAGDREDRGFGEKRDRNFGDRRPHTTGDGERKERSDGWNRDRGIKKTEAWNGSEDIRLKSDVLGTQGWAKNAESQPETVRWDTKPEARPTDSFIEERLVINQAYEVYVSFIISSKEFYCSLTHKSDNLDAVMKKLATLGAANSLTKIDASAVQQDKAVVSVYTEDNSLYRAKVLTPPNAGFVQVQYVDYGNSEKVSVANLKTLPSELLELPSQAIPCMLPQEVEKFRENIEAHEYVKIKVTNVDGEKTTVDVFTTDGKIIYKMKPSPVGKKMEVYLSHMISPYEFYCQSTNANTLDTIITLLSEFTNTTRLESQEIKPGQVCLGVFSEDSSLYRGIIIQIIEAKAKILVQFMDYGNSEVIHPSKIYQMPSNISSFPTQAYKCAIVHPTYKIAEDKIALFVTKMNEQEKIIIDIKEAALNQYLLVDLLDASGKPIPLPFTVPTSTSIAEPPNYPVGASIKCRISHIVNPTDFYCQNLSITDTLDKLMNDIDNDITNNQLSKLKSFEVGTQCVAQYSEHNGWYRGVIIKSADAGNYLVQYIDYGNNEKVYNKNMYSPKPEYLAIPPCAFRCGIAVVEPTCGWSESLNSEFSNKVKEINVILQIVETSAGGYYKVKMLDQFGIEEIILPETKVITIVKDELKCELVPTLKRPINIYISFINSIHLFYVQQSDCEEELSALMEKVHKECTNGSGSAPTEWCVGMFCLAKFVDDGAWYRSRVEEVAEDHVTVNYIDYGNSQIVSKTDVLSINQNLLQKPFAMPCRFTASYGLKTTPEIEVKFEEYMPEPLVLNIVHKGIDGVFECELTTQVESTDDPVDVGKELAELLSEETRANEILNYCERTASDLTELVLANTISFLSNSPSSLYKRNPLPINSTQTVYLTQTNNEQGQFYVQLSNSDAAIQELMGSIAQFCTDPVNMVQPDSLQIETPCLAKFTEDDTWYRAEIQETYLEFDHVKLLFIDYGNTQITHIDFIVKIPTDLLRTPVFSYLCKFDTSYLIPEGFDLSSTMSAYEMESLLNLEVKLFESSVHQVKLTTDELQDIGDVISCLVPLETKQVISFKQQTKFVNKLIDGLIQDVVTKLEDEVNFDETAKLLDSYADEYVECIIRTAQSKLELEEETAIDQLVNDVINTSSNHVSRIHEGFKTQQLSTDQRISVNLSHIVSTQCFYIQVLSQAVDLFQVTEEVESYCSDPTNTTPLNCVETELPVLAVFSQDSAWYRGIVTSTCETRNKFKVLFVDFGNSDEVPENLICHLPDNLLSKASFSYQCKLSSEYGLNDDMDTIQKFTELTEMKTDLMMEVVDFKDDVYEVRLFDGSEGEVGVLMNTLPFFYPDPNEPPYPVTLTCFNSLNSFYLQTETNRNSLHDLQTQMVEYCNSTGDISVNKGQLLSGILVLVYSKDSQSWNRAKIISNSEFTEEPSVQLIDYGPVLSVPISNIRLLSPRSPLTILPPIAFHCRIPAHYCVIPCNPVNEEFVKPRALTATFNGPLPPNNQFEAEVFDTDKRLAVTLEKLSSPFRKWKYVFPSPDTVKNVLISSIDTVLNFYVQESGSETVIAELMENVSNICQSTKPVVSLTNEDLYEGMAVLSVFSEDEQWYRAQVMKVDDKIQVCFVDYGNTDNITVRNIRNVPYELLSVAPLAYPCKFHSEIGLVSGPEIEKSFKSFIRDVELSMKVLSTASEHIEVELSTSADPNKDIGQTLFFEIPEEVRAKLLGNDLKESIFGERTDSQNSTDCIYKLTLPPINSTIKGIASNIITIQDFYIQDNELTSELVSLTQLTPSPTELNIVSNISVDDMVLAKFSGDEEIYRGRVINIGEELVKIFFIDYGNSDLVPKNHIYQIPGVQKSYPCYALPCCLDCDLPTSELTTDKLSEVLEDKDLEVVIKDHKDKTSLIVDILLIDNGESVVDILRESLNNEMPECEQDTLKTAKTDLDKSPKKLCKAIDTPVFTDHPALPPDAPVFPELDLEKEDGSKFEATLTHSNNLFSFYLHKKSSQDQVNELMDKLLSHCGTTDSTPPPVILPGMAVIAMMDGDGSWYRGQIVEKKEDNSYSVFSVDYGNIETITSDQILPISPEFLQEPLAYPCKLYLADDKSLPDTAFDTFTNLLDDTTCQIEVMSVEENMLEVKIGVIEGDVFTQIFKI